MRGGNPVVELAAVAEQLECGTWVVRESVLMRVWDWPRRSVRWFVAQGLLEAVGPEAPDAVTLASALRVRAESERLVSDMRRRGGCS